MIDLYHTVSTEASAVFLTLAVRFLVLVQASTVLEYIEVSFLNGVYETIIPAIQKKRNLGATR